MNTKRKSDFPRKDYSEEQLYSKDPNKKKPWKQRDYKGGIYSDSETGGEAKDKQNPWQGSQDRWEQP